MRTFWIAAALVAVGVAAFVAGGLTASRWAQCAPGDAGLTIGGVVIVGCPAGPAPEHDPEALPD